jgi:hypothetical protein
MNKVLRKIVLNLMAGDCTGGKIGNLVRYCVRAILAREHQGR